LELETSLRRALERQEFLLHYQPRIDLETGRARSMEALVRWQHPKWGLVPPGEFIPLAEETGLILEIGEWAMQEACATLELWRQAGLEDVSIAVNVSALQLARGHLPDVVARVNGENVTKADFERMLKTIEARAGQPIPADRRDEIVRGALDQLITYTLLAQESKTRGIKIEETEIEATFVLGGPLYLERRVTRGGKNQSGKLCRRALYTARSEEALGLSKPGALSGLTPPEAQPQLIQELRLREEAVRRFFQVLALRFGRQDVARGPGLPPCSAPSSP
jgi:hypothetical protein